ncbi:MAG TPA: hypothetical protein P5181_05660, partial [Dermatophilaceae bacterium]|nr:hypothetical protein [Dermatophilaceae bacterium]
LVVINAGRGLAGSVLTSEMLARELRGAHVVRAFNNIFWGHLGALVRPHGDGERTGLPIAGDDAAAKQQVTELLDASFRLTASRRLVEALDTPT